MGIYRVTNGAVGKALPIGAGNDTISGPSAWLFENQSGTLGTNLTGSLIYVGATGDVRAILSDVVGIQNKVTGLNLDAIFKGANPFYAGFAAGSGYVEGNAVATTDVTTVPNSPATVPAGLTVDIVVPVPSTNALTPGTGYSVAPFTILQGGGMSGNILSVSGAGAILTFEIIDGGIGYTVGDVLTIVQAGGSNGSITLATAPNGAVTEIDINATGANYSVGDIITVAQAGSGLDCKFCIRAVQSDLPVIGDAVIFRAVPAGTILPVAVDYVMATGSSATGMVACK
jgi:hypothetical protein